MSSQTYLTLPSGQKLPAFGLGTFLATDEKELETALHAALELGYRHIDTAWAYQNEKTIGKVLKEWISSGKIKREELFITTKLPMIAIHPDRVESFMKQSLKNLQLDYVDLYLIHTPIGAKYKEGLVRPYTLENGDIALEGKTDHVGIWKKMEEQVDAGRAKNIGLSNYNITQIQTVLDAARIKPANLQVEVHIYCQRKELIDFCHKNGITVVAYSPFGNPGHVAQMIKNGQGPETVRDILGNSVIKSLAEKHKKTPAQVALKFLLQLELSVIPKSVRPERVKENFDVFDFTLEKDDIEALRNLDEGQNGSVFSPNRMKGIGEHPDYPWK